MGILCDYFIAKPIELKAACRGWVEPLDEPRTISGINPFTREAIAYPSWTPVDVDLEDADSSPDLSRFSPKDLKGTDITALADLGSIVLDKSYETMMGPLSKPALVGPDTSDLILSELPADMVAALASLQAEPLQNTAEKWAAARRADLASVPDNGSRQIALEQHNRTVWTALLQTLVSLARQAVSEKKRMYVAMSP